ncbi:MAG: prepilin-type N-terminal cleavage/methylation domain-containing protein [Actinomycetia bacterium]|nr:prepilin-type N-terminal cleavage/methylation domain-containing protein [Actinomycetes bacterium]
MPRRRAFTLMEMLLVLAILVIASAAVMPSLRGVMRTTTLRSGADLVRSELTRAHVLAMRTGRIHVVRYELNGRKLTVEPWIGDDDALESPDGQQSEVFNSAVVRGGAAQRQEKNLPEGVVFVGGDVGLETRSRQIEEAVISLGESTATWSRPIFFYPDGSTSDAYVVVGDDRKLGIRLDLRGLTGTVKVGDVQTLDALSR